MKYFRNPELKKELFLYLTITVLLTGIALYIRVPLGVCVLALCTLFIFLHFGSLWRRYKDIETLSYDINRVLHGDDSIWIHEMKEGELSILQSEISKIMMRLRIQAEELAKDKMFLADSIADISHQIRTPLTSLNLIVSRLAVQELDGMKRLELTKELEQMLSRIDWLVHTLLRMSKLDANAVLLQQKEIQVKELFESALEPIRIPMELREQTVQINGAEGVSFLGDFSWTMEAIANIVKNCMEHTPRGGRIFLEAEKTPIYIELRIGDNGGGIAKEDLPHLFERFYKGKNSAKESFGIGLALSRMIILRQNGRINVGNRPEGGALFTIRFYQ